ncbi:anti-sigma factor family protein [Paenibacillus soyae]|uniref:Zf-HC2 domain-containing protein n=1 Tax=Paenibacillus soyae TaxID=2969249 RepID=A0A9X2S7M2_9BACL|nr:zf-HC2 domain-containing protein [Paenibacillus soyae]MCR2803211.1 zf-HC2 domain-containing protein [Paenibacillus soyae]
MNCQEVMELMQRQLDDDLGDEEFVVLNDHIRQCPDCAAAFERLKRLSSDLASLPKVTPRYSLVDAILPELERIDLEARQAEHVIATAPASDPAEEKLGESRRLKRSRKWPSWSAVGSVVAAGVVAGLFLLNAPGFGGGANDKADFSADLDHGGAANSSAAEMYNVEGAANGDQAGGDISTDVLRKFATDNPDSQGEEASGASSGGSSEPAERDTRFVASETTNEDLGDEPVSPNVAIEDVPEAPSITDGAGTQGFEGTPAGGEGEASGEPVEPIEPSEDQAGDNKAGPDMGIAAAVFLSPDGLYSAAVDEYSVIIASTESGEVVHQTDRKNGHHSGLVWSEDGAQLTYEVQLDHGAAEKYVISTSDWTEKKASH